MRQLVFLQEGFGKSLYAGTSGADQRSINIKEDKLEHGCGGTNRSMITGSIPDGEQHV